MRLDIAIIYPHGVEYLDQILEILRKYKDLELVYLRYYEPYDFTQFIEDVYGVDTVPIQHLRAKNKYLEGIGKETYIMLIKNHKPEEVIVGEGEYQHIQCMLINRFKWHVRELFNPVRDGQRTEDHVIHTTDYEKQVYDLWPKFKLHTIDSIITPPCPEFPHIPFHIGGFSSYEIHQIDLDKHYCHEMTDEENIAKPISESMAYKFLKGDEQPYRDYWKKYRGVRLWSDHSPEKLDEMRNIKYLEPPHQNEYIVTHGGQIVDGVHRAAILKYQGVKECLAITKV